MFGLFACQETPEVGTEFKSMTAEDLKHACRARGLSGEGNKSDLVKRLTVSFFFFFHHNRFSRVSITHTPPRAEEMKVLKAKKTQIKEVPTTQHVSGSRYTPPRKVAACARQIFVPLQKQYLKYNLHTVLVKN